MMAVLTSLNLIIADKAGKHIRLRFINTILCILYLRRSKISDTEFHRSVYDMYNNLFVAFQQSELCGG